MLNRFNLRFFILFLFVGSFICSGKINYSESLIKSIVQEDHSDPLFLSVDTTWADSVLATLSLEEKIAQMIMVAAYSNKGSEHVRQIVQIIQKRNIGGLVFFQGSPVKQAELTNYYQSFSKTPLIIGMDAEWGLGMRLDSTISYPYQMSLGAIKNNELIYKMGLHIGNQLKRLGVHINFAPVADINNNPRNPVVNFRSFGENRVDVAVKAYNYSRGLSDAGIISTLKHFPGHGDTDIDSHYSLPVIHYSRQRLDSVEFYPFKFCIANGVPGVMTAHLNIPALDSASDKASSLSYQVVTNLLQKELKFKGLIFSDALSMKGVSDYFKPGELEIQAFMAGNDILLLPSDVDKTINFLKREIRKGNIEEDEVNRRVKKILMAKYWAGLNFQEEIQTDSLYEDLNSPVYKAFKNELIRNSFTVIKNKNSTIPLHNFESLNLGHISIGVTENDIFSETLELYYKTTTFSVSGSADISEFKKIKSKLEDFNTLIISIHNTSQYSSRQFGLTRQIIEFLNELEFDGKIILCYFGNPYAIDKFNDLDHIDAIMIAYEDKNEVKYLAAQGIFGAFELSGKLPVSVNSNFTFGISEIIPFNFTLSYGIPEEMFMSSDMLSKIDSVVSDAIEAKAAPGCQILVARHGRVIYNKSMGFHTYEEKHKLRSTDLFDLASITKISATLPLLMQFYEQGKFDLEDSIGKYIPGCDTTNKAGLTFADILAHQAGLQSWIPFYYSLLECPDSLKPILSNRYTSEYPYKIAAKTYFNKNVRLKENVYDTKLSAEFPLHLAQNIYLHKSYKDTVYQQIINSPVNPSPKYLYSDLGNYLFHLTIEDIAGEYLYPLVFNKFYLRIGAETLGYLPLNRFPKENIVPTENDVVFRKQLLQGYVHDPGAAMLGGISGHAGLFSNANDLAKMMQMYLNDGVYAGKRFISDTIIHKFTACHFCNNGNRRGLGFDKPEPDPKKISPASKLASQSSYGHTGFTGTIAWMDPEYGLLYIFLSNRIHPDQANQKLIDMNIRTKIHDIIYESLLDTKLELEE